MASASRILNEFGKPFEASRSHRSLPDQTARRSRPVRMVEGRYDAVQTTDMNSAYWAAADALDADAANSLSVRKKYRERSRYEQANNPYLAGMIETRVTHEIGVGPTLQMETLSKPFNEMVQRVWQDWEEEVLLTEILSTLTGARIGDGEGCATIINNPALEHGVKLDVRPWECDRLTDPMGLGYRENYVDGITLDQYGNPASYDVLRYHPGAQWTGGRLEYDTVPADFIIHLFRKKRPGQHRGIPEVGPSLNIFPGMRRLTGATIKAAEVAADISIALETDTVPGSEPAEITPGAVDIPMGTLWNSPYGWKAKQLKAEHPNEHFPMVRREIVGEAGRCLMMSRGLATGDSAEYNFASGRLDHQPYFCSISVCQWLTTRKVLRKLFRHWFREAVDAYGWAVSADTIPPHSWNWTGQPYSDPESEANAIQTNLCDGMTTFDIEYARRGLTREREWAKQAEALGVSVQEFQQLVRDRLFGAKPQAASPPSPSSQERNGQPRAGYSPSNGRPAAVPSRNGVSR